MKRISIQGIRGAFHEEAASIYFQKNIDVLEHYTFEELVSAVAMNESDYGIMAIENSISGTIHNNLELIKKYKLNISGEIYHRIEQNLAAKPGTRVEELTRVESHYMAINQCRTFFRDYPEIKLVDIEDTALGMKRVREHDSSALGAIGSRLAAEYYGLEIIAGGIETNKENYTRFLILERASAEQSDSKTNKATVNFVTSHKKGALASVLNVINQCDINLTKIESLPIIGEPWHYQFYIDILFPEEVKFLQMKELLAAQVESLRVLGVYEASIINQPND